MKYSVTNSCTPKSIYRFGFTVKVVNFLLLEPVKQIIDGTERVHFVSLSKTLN